MNFLFGYLPELRTLHSFGVFRNTDYSYLDCLFVDFYDLDT